MPTQRGFRIWALIGLLVAAGSARAQEEVTIPMGTEIKLALLHHVNSKYSPPGTKVYFRVTDDVKVADTVVIPAGTVAVGKVTEATKSKSLGRAGNMAVEVKTVKALDGTLIPLDIDLSAKGRSRTGATVGMVIGFGLPGLFTKGRMAYFEKGDVFTANVTVDRKVGSGPETAPPAEAPSPALALKLVAMDDDVKLKIEKGKKLDPVDFRVDSAAAGPAVGDIDVSTVALYKVADVMVPETVGALDVVHDRLRFDGWPLMKYLDVGDNHVEFRGSLKDGTPFAASGSLRMVVVKKKKKS